MVKKQQDTPDLFKYSREAQIAREAPLATRMRPRTLDEFVGQEHIIGPGRLLRRAIQADQLSSVIFYGPPGTGKTTLAAVIANTTRSHFVTLNAVLAGVKDIREVTADAQERRKLHGQRTILFVDEVHRWNKAQQDALLPWVENGTIILIGATTENPYFEVNKALVSRSRIFQLKPLVEADLRRIAAMALSDPERGYGKWNVRVDEEALDHLVNVANGDARGVLNALELAVETTPPGPDGAIHVDMAVAEESIQRRAVLYDKEGDVHYDTISAFIKSLRGSDPDAAMYWLAKMVYAGEDPRFIFRRMLIFAGEDVGLADPDAMRVVVACAQAFEYVGLPEGRFHLAEAALYLATAPKSNSVFAFFDALTTVEKEREPDVPAHLKDASRDKEGFGHGEGYLYPHAYRDHWVAQQYLPDSLQGKVFYQPGDLGYEKAIRVHVARRREAQLAAMLEGDALAPLEVLTFSPQDRARDRWLQRTISRTGEHLAALRDRILDAARLQRHHLVLDLNAGSGLLTWEALRRTPEGGVWALVSDPQAAEALRQQAAGLAELERPIVIPLPTKGAWFPLENLATLIAAQSRVSGDLVGVPNLLGVSGVPPQQVGDSGSPTTGNSKEPHSRGDIRFDAVVGRNALTRHPDKVAAVQGLASVLRPGGIVSLAEIVPRHTQRLYALVDCSQLSANGLAERIVAAEEAIYRSEQDPMVNWDTGELRAAFETAGFADVRIDVERQASEARITPALIERWFSTEKAPVLAEITGVSGTASQEQRPTYAQHLLRHISPEELAQVRALFEQQLSGQTVTWATTTALVTGRKI